MLRIELAEYLNKIYKFCIVLADRQRKDRWAGKHELNEMKIYKTTRHLQIYWSNGHVVQITYFVFAFQRSWKYKDNWNYNERP